MAFILPLDAAPPPGRLGRGTKGDVLDRASFLDRASSVRLAFGFGASRGFVVVVWLFLCCVVCAASVWDSCVLSIYLPSTAALKMTDSHSRCVLLKCCSYLTTA